MGKKRLLRMVQTALMLALLVSVQVLTKPGGQILTGSCVNGILAVSALLIGPAWASVVALISPILAFTLGITPNVVIVPVIMLGNLTYVLLLGFLADARYSWRLALAVVGASAAKFVVQYTLVSQVVCGVAAQWLIGQGVLKPPMLSVLTAMFSWPQLPTALVGGILAGIVVPPIKKATQK